LRELEVIGKIVENATFRNQENVEQLVHHLELMGPACEVITHCKKILSQPCFEIDEESTHPAAIECISSMFRILMNLTNENVPGYKKFGHLDGLHVTTECLVLFDASQFDMLMLALALLVNTTEHSESNRLRLRSVSFRTAGKSKRDSERKVTALESICKLFTDLIEQQKSGGKQAVSKMATLREEDEKSKAGGTVKALSDALMSYTAILIGVLSKEPDNYKDFKEILGDKFQQVSIVIQQHLKDQAEVGVLSAEMETSLTSILVALESL